MQFLKKLFPFLFLLCALQSFAQESKELIPDGTEGEVFDTAAPKRKYANWNQFDGSLTTLRLSGGFLFEAAADIQDDEAKRQTDSIGEGLDHFDVRDFRICAGGVFKFKFKRTISWKAGLMYDGDKDSWFLRETGLMVQMPELSGHIFVGRTKEGFSLNKVMNGYSGWTMERQMALDVIPILSDGIKYLGFLPKQRILWNIGIYTNYLAKNQGFATYKWHFAMRVGWMPFYSADKKKLMHVALNYRYGKIKNDAIRVKSRPEVNSSPYFIDTGTFPAEHSNHVGGEIYFSAGPFMMGSEYYVHMFSSTVVGDANFRGGDVVVTYILTGESRPYNTTGGNIYGFIPVDKPVFQGGPGAWEVLFRFSTLDLDDGNIQGGKFWRITPMVNWYLSKNVRLELAYGYGVLDRFGLQGATHFFQSRIQLAL